jgi:hypothetical protein
MSHNLLILPRLVSMVSLVERRNDRNRPTHFDDWEWYRERVIGIVCMKHSYTCINCKNVQCHSV